MRQILMVVVLVGLFGISFPNGVLGLQILPFDRATAATPGDRPSGAPGDSACEKVLNTLSTGVLTQWRFQLEERITQRQLVLDDEHRRTIEVMSAYHHYAPDYLKQQIDNLVHQLTPQYFPSLARFCVPQSTFTCDGSLPSIHELNTLIEPIGFIDQFGSLDRSTSNLVHTIFTQILIFRRQGALDSPGIDRTKLPVPSSVSSELGRTIVRDEILYALRANGIMGAIGTPETAFSTTYRELRQSIAQENVLGELETAPWFNQFQSLKEVEAAVVKVEASATPAMKQLANYGTFNVIEKRFYDYTHDNVTVWPRAMFNLLKRGLRVGSSTYKHTDEDVIGYLRGLISAKANFDRIAAVNREATVFGNAMDGFGALNKGDFKENRIRLYQSLEVIRNLVDSTGEERDTINRKFFSEIGWLTSELDLLKFLQEKLPKAKDSDFEKRVRELMQMRELAKAINLGV